MKPSIVALLVFIAIVLLVLGATELNDETSMGPKSRRVFFGLAALAIGAAAGILVH
jgi:hypothetical protein